MELEKAKEVEYLLKRIEDAECFVSFLQKAKGTLYLSKKTIHRDIEKIIPEAIAEKIDLLSRDYLNSLREELRRL